MKAANGDLVFWGGNSSTRAEKHLAVSLANKWDFICWLEMENNSKNFMGGKFGRDVLWRISAAENYVVETQWDILPCEGFQIKMKAWINMSDSNTLNWY